MNCKYARERNLTKMHYIQYLFFCDIVECIIGYSKIDPIFVYTRIRKPLLTLPLLADIYLEYGGGLYLFPASLVHVINRKYKLLIFSFTGTQKIQQILVYCVFVASSQHSFGI